MNDTPEQVEATIAALEAQRRVLGDSVCDAAVASLREKLAALRPPQQPRLKTVTVLFADVVGSTATARELDPEDIQAIFDGALDRLRAVVDAHGGRVLQFAGDGLLAAFGADAVHEDDAENAVRAGLAMLDVAKHFAEQVRTTHGLAAFDMRVGAHSGQVLLGGGVDDAASIRGSSVNLAARMEQSAPCGALRISHATWRLVHGVFDVVEQAPIALKGLAEPMRSYLVQRERPREQRSAGRGVEGVATPLVGRDDELARLTDAFNAMLDERAWIQVTLIGDAGLGKSRLMREFGACVERQERAVLLLRGHAQARGSSLPYGLIRDLLCRHFHVQDSDSLAEAQARLYLGLAPLFGGQAEEQAALVGQLIGLDFSASPHIAGILADARQIRDRGRHALAQMFRRLAGEGPVVMLLDDLHWADDDSLDVIGQLAGACRGVPMLVLCAARGALLERRPRWGSGQADDRRVELAPLNRQSSRALASALLQRIAEPPAALRELITGDAEGNPFYMEELTKMLIDDGVIVTAAGDEPWRVAPERLASARVPPTLTGVILARLDALPADERAALQLAAVVGAVFWDEALRRLQPQAICVLPALVRRELIRDRETTAFEGAREFVFRHHMLHEVTYDSVLKRDKRAQHGVIAEWLVARSGERIAEHRALIAGHFERAGDASSAAHHLRQAGEDAARSFAVDAAIDYLTRALALTPDGDAEARFDLLLTRALMFDRKGQMGELLADVQALEQLAERLDDDVARARAAGQRARHGFRTADYGTATTAAARSVAWAEAAGMPQAAMVARGMWGNALQALGDNAGAQAQAELTQALARAAGDRHREMVALNELGGVASELGRYAVALHYYQELLAQARQDGNRLMESNALGNIGDLERRFGNYAAARELTEAALRVDRALGVRPTEMIGLANLATIAHLQGDAQEALAWAAQALAIAREVEDRDTQASTLAIRADALLALGRMDEAEAGYRESLALFREIGRPTMAPEPLAGLARVALSRGDSDAAMAHVEGIVAHLDGGGNLGGTEDPLRIHLTCHQVLAAAGAPRADEFLARAHASLMEQAQELDAAERQRFLAVVPSHAAIVAAWNEREAQPGA